MIQVENLTKFYGDRCAIDSVNFSVETGHVVGFLGLNGTGKTTILRILAGDLEPSSGSISVQNRHLVDDPVEYRRHVGFLPERIPIYPNMTVDEHLTFMGSLHGVERAQLKKSCDDVCERVALNEYRREPVANLSHGFRKRLGIAAAIIHNPALVILDEPISGLDPVQIVEMRALVRSLAGERTVLISSHILNEISQTCDRLLVLSQSKIVARGTEAEITQNRRAQQQMDFTVRTDQENAVRIAQSEPSVSNIQVTEESNGFTSIRVSAPTDVREALVFSFVEEGIGVIRVERATDELEAAFLSLAQTQSTQEAEE